MSLKTLLFSILSAMMILLWSATFIAVFNNEKKEIETELYNNSKNVAQSLSLSLSHTNGDKTLMKTMINAVFDGGHFNQIVLTDNNNNIIYKRIKEINEYHIPSWFKKLIKLSSPTANANVSNGWNPIGIIYVQNDVEYGYDKLYRIFIQLSLIYIFATIISILVLKIILNEILKPLEEIKKQAEEIINRNFIIIKKLPFIKELREVTQALNKMIEKLKIMFENANKEIVKLKQKEYIDPLTSLKNRKYFIEKLNSLINGDENILEGINIFISLQNLEEANKKLGRIKTDNMIKEIASSIKNFLDTKLIPHLNNNYILARLNGSEFAVFIPNISIEEGEKIIFLLKSQIDKIVSKYTNTIETVIGAYVVESSAKLEEILSNTDKAVATAKVNQQKIFILKSKYHTPYSKEEWKKIIKTALENNLIDFITYNAVNTKNHTINHKTLSLCIKNQDKILKYSEFIPAAIHLDLLDDIYKAAIEKLIGSNFAFNKYSFKLPLEFIYKTNNFLFVEKMFQKNKLNFELILELPEKFLIEDIETAKELVKIIKNNNLKFGIYNFIAESKNFDYIINLAPEFIKSDKNFYITQQNEILIHLKNIAITTETDLIATGVNEIKYLDILKEKGIYIIQGSVTDKLIKGD